MRGYVKIKAIISAILVLLCVGKDAHSAQVMDENYLNSSAAVGRFAVALREGDARTLNQFLDAGLTRDTFNRNYEGIVCRMMLHTIEKPRSNNDQKRAYNKVLRLLFERNFL